MHFFRLLRCDARKRKTADCRGFCVPFFAGLGLYAQPCVHRSSRPDAIENGRAAYSRKVTNSHSAKKIPRMRVPGMTRNNPGPLKTPVTSSSNRKVAAATRVITTSPRLLLQTPCTIQGQEGHQQYSSGPPQAHRRLRISTAQSGSFRSISVKDM